MSYKELGCLEWQIDFKMFDIKYLLFYYTPNDIICNSLALVRNLD